MKPGATAAMRLIFITLFLDLLGFGIALPQMPFYAKMCGVGGTLIGLITGTYSLLQFLMAPVWGRFSDRHGRRPVILIGLAGAGVAYAIFGAAFRISAATGIPAVAIVVVSRMMAGFFNANIGVAQAYMADVTPPEQRTAAMGTVGAAIALGFVMGPAISICIELTTGSPELPFYLAALSELACFFWALAVLPETRPKEATEVKRTGDRPWHLVTSNNLRVVLLTAGLVTASFSGMENTLGFYVNESEGLQYGPNGFALVLLWLSFVIVITNGVLVKPMARRMRETRMLALGSAALALGLFGLGAAWNTPTLYLAVTLNCFGYGLASPSLAGINAKLAPEAVRGELLGLGQSMTSLGRVVGPILGGWWYQSVSRGGSYVVGGAIAVGCFALALHLDGQVIE